MSPADDVDGAEPPFPKETEADLGGRIYQQLFESLVHHLMEKGVLTKNDALSVVQTVAQVTRGALHEGQAPAPRTRTALRILQRMYASFEAVAERPGLSQIDGENVHRLRPPVHGDRPEFPRED